MPIKSFYSTPPGDLKDGDVFVAVVTCHLIQVDHENKTVAVKVYRCDYPPETFEGVPQGSPTYGDPTYLARALFPVLNGFDKIVEGN